MTYERTNTHTCCLEDLWDADWEYVNAGYECVFGCEHMSILSFSFCIVCIVKTDVV